MKIDIDKLRKSFLDTWEKRYNDLDLSESEWQEKLAKKYQPKTIAKLLDEIEHRINSLCYYQAVPDDFEKLSKEQQQEHQNKELDAELKRQDGFIFRSSDLRYLYRQFYLEAKLCNKEELYAKVMSKIIMIGNRNYYPLEVNQLKLFFDYGFDLYLITRDDSWQEEKDPQVFAIDYFKLENDKDYTIDIDRVLLKPATYKNIHTRIENIIKDIGGIETLYLLFTNYIDNKYNSELERYLIYRKKDFMSQGTDIPVPYQYLIQITVKHLSLPKDRKFDFNFDLFNELIKISTFYIALLGIYDSNPYSDMLLDYEGIPQYLQDNMILETLCFPRQYSPKFIELLIKKIYAPTFIDASNYPSFYNTKSFIELIKTILGYRPCSIINIDELSKKVRINKKHIKEFLLHFSQESKNINPQFNSILEEATFENTPLIQLTENDFFLVSAHFCGYAFCEKIYQTIKPNYHNKKGFERALGDNLEILVKELLKNKGYSYKCGYYSPKNNEQGECDLIIEDDKKALFIELKNCGLPYEFEQGDIITVLNFLTMGMLKAQEQILRHKLHLENHNHEMQLYKDINASLPYTSLNIKDKRTYSISLCTTEYAFFTIGEIGKRLIESTLFVTYSPNDPSRVGEFEKLNKLSGKINNLTEEHAKIKKGITTQELFFESSFKSLQQFWLILKKSKSISEFIDIFTCTTHFQNPSLDYYVNLWQYLQLNKTKASK